MSYPVILQNARLLEEIDNELARARKLHVPINSAHEAYAVILEELDEYWDHVKTNPRKLSAEAQAKRLSEMRKELIQIAAMALRAITDTLPDSA